jgi:hypothetical protein
MWTLTAITVAFLVVSVAVVVLARSTTARWERESRATRPRRPAAAPATRRERVAARLGSALADAAATARPAVGPVRAALSRTGQTLAASRRRIARAVGHVPGWRTLRPAGYRRPFPTGTRGRAGRSPAFPRLAHRLAEWRVHRPGAHRSPPEVDEPAGPPA